jgi:glutaredoxin
MITLYSKPGCVHCESAKAWLTKHGFDYSAVDITTDPEARTFVVSAGHRTVPQIYHEGRLLVEGGFSGLNALTPDQLREKLNAA